MNVNEKVLGHKFNSEVRMPSFVIILSYLKFEYLEEKLCSSPCFGYCFVSCSMGCILCIFNSWWPELSLLFGAHYIVAVRDIVSSSLPLLSQVFGNFGSVAL